MDITPEIYQLGSIAVIFVFAIREFFAYLRGKQPDGKKDERQNEKQDEKQDISLAVVNEKLKTIETNISNHIIHKLAENDKDHQEIKVNIAEIKTKLDILIEHFKI